VGQALPKSGTLSDSAQGAALGQRNEERPQHENPSTLKPGWLAPGAGMKITEFCITT